MRRWLYGSMLKIFFVLLLAGGAHGQVCPRLQLKLDPRLSPNVVRQEWASGDVRVEAPALLELRGCKGELIDRLTLPAALARLDRVPLKGAPVLTYLVSADLTADAGSYNGPLTLPIQVKDGHLHVAEATGPDGHREEIHLALTGKAAWKKVAVGGVDDLLSVSCQPQDGGFITFYRRYHPAANGWRMRVRSEPGIWESDGDFPSIRRFP